MRTIKCFRSGADYIFFDNDAQLVNEIANKTVEQSPQGRPFIKVPVTEIYQLRDRAMNADLFFQIP